MKVAIGQDSHRIDDKNKEKKLKLGGITDSEEYLKEALKYLKEKIIHISISIECFVPKVTPKIPEMRKNIARILKIDENAVGITATTGEGLTECGKGNGIQVFACLTVE